MANRETFTFQGQKIEYQLHARKPGGIVYVPGPDGEDVVMFQLGSVPLERVPEEYRAIVRALYESNYGKLP
jgi:hypothetical protein